MKLWELDKSKEYHCDSDVWVWNEDLGGWHGDGGYRRTEQMSFKCASELDFIVYNSKPEPKKLYAYYKEDMVMPTIIFTKHNIDMGNHINRAPEYDIEYPTKGTE